MSVDTVGSNRPSSSRLPLATLLTLLLPTAALAQSGTVGSCAAAYPGPLAGWDYQCVYQPGTDFKLTTADDGEAAGSVAVWTTGPRSSPVTWIAFQEWDTTATLETSNEMYLLRLDGLPGSSTASAFPLAGVRSMNGIYNLAMTATPSYVYVAAQRGCTAPEWTCPAVPGAVNTDIRHEVIEFDVAAGAILDRYPLYAGADPTLTESTGHVDLAWTGAARRVAAAFTWREASSTNEDVMWQELDSGVVSPSPPGLVTDGAGQDTSEDDHPRLMVNDAGKWTLTHVTSASGAREVKTLLSHQPPTYSLSTVIDQNTATPADAGSSDESGVGLEESRRLVTWEQPGVGVQEVWASTCRGMELDCADPGNWQRQCVSCVGATADAGDPNGFLSSWPLGGPRIWLGFNAERSGVRARVVSLFCRSAGVFQEEVVSDTTGSNIARTQRSRRHTVINRDRLHTVFIHENSIVWASRPVGSC